MPRWANQPGAQPVRPSGGGIIQSLKGAYDRAFAPFSWLPEDSPITKWNEDIANRLGVPWAAAPARMINEIPYELTKYLVGSPGGLATTAATLGTSRVVPPVARGVASLVDLLGSSAGAARGAVDVAEGIGEGSPSKIGLGAVQTALGSLGARQGLRGIRPQPVPSPIPTVQPPAQTIIPGKRRLAAAPEPRGLLPPATNLEIIPQVPPPPARFVAGRAGIAEAGQTYPAYQPSDLGAAQAAGRFENLLDQPSPGRIPGMTAAEYGTAPNVVTPTRSEIISQRYRATFNTLIQQGKTPTEAHQIASQLVETTVPSPPVTHVGREFSPYEPQPRQPDWYSGPMREFPEPPVAGVKTRPPAPVEEPFQSTYPPTGRVATITRPEMKGAKKILKGRTVGQQPQTAQPVSSSPRQEMSAGKRLVKGIGVAIETELERMGPAGKTINQMLGRTSMFTRQRAAKWEEPFGQLGLKTPEEQAAFFDAMESGVPPTDPKIRAAVDKIRASGIDKEAGETITRVGLLDPDTKQPVRPLENYAPHVRPTGETAEQLAAAFKQRFPGLTDDEALAIAQGRFTGGKDIVDKLMSRLGVDRDTAMLIRDIGRAKGERKISSQYSRKLNLPGYRKDLDVWKEHYYDVAKRTSEQEVLGRLDTGDPESQISKLIEKTPNPQYTKDLVNAHLGRTAYPGGQKLVEAANKLNDTATNVLSRMYLSLFPISNTANQMTIPMVTNTKSYAKAITSAIRDPKAARHIASESGALYNVTKGILEAGDMYGIKKSENMNRIIAAGAGRAYVTDLFEGLQKGTLKPKDLERLAEFTDTTVEKLVKQGALTEQQLKNAGFKVAELSQGLSEARKLPELWSNPYLKTIFIFRKYAFQQTKIVKDALKRDPVRNGAILLAASQGLGEAIGGAKAVLRGTVRGTLEGDVKKGVKKELTDRTAATARLLPSGLAENKLAVRVVDNMIQSWALGLVADLMYATTGKESLLSTLVGPLWSTAGDFADAGVQAISGRPAPLGRAVTRPVPYVGPGIQRALFPTQQQQGRKARYP